MEAPHEPHRSYDSSKPKDCPVCGRAVEPPRRRYDRDDCQRRARSLRRSAPDKVAMNREHVHRHRLNVPKHDSAVYARRLARAFLNGRFRGDARDVGISCRCLRIAYSPLRLAIRELMHPSSQWDVMYSTGSVALSTTLPTRADVRFSYKDWFRADDDPLRLLPPPDADFKGHIVPLLSPSESQLDQGDDDEPSWVRLRKSPLRVRISPNWTVGHHIASQIEHILLQGLWNRVCPILIMTIPGCQAKPFRCLYMLACRDLTHAECD